MALPIMAVLAAIGPTLGEILKKVIPDADDRAKAQEEIVKTVAGLDSEVLKGQQRLNEKQADNASLFVAGARPFAMWGFTAALLYCLVLQPYVVWFAYLYNLPVFPQVDTEALMNLTVAILGLAGIRGWETVRGKARSSIK